jgi:putative iron-regulated protein
LKEFKVKSRETPRRPGSASKRLHYPVTGLALASLLLTGCDQPNDGKPLAAVPVATAAHNRELSSTLNEQLDEAAFAAFTQASQSSTALLEETRQFLDSPNATTLATLRAHWRQAYSDFLKTRFFGFLPISDPPDWQRQHIGNRGTLALLDTWPIEGGYIDYLPEYPYSGIVNDLTLELSADSLLSQHGLSDVSSASLGFHPMEFLLWGADGQRSASDYLPLNNATPGFEGSTDEPPMSTDTADTDNSNDQDSGDENNEGAASEFSDNESDGLLAIPVQNNLRRRQYLLLVAEHINEHIHRLQRRWEPGNGYYSTLISRSKPGQTLSAGLMAAQKLLNDELISKRLVLPSSEFSTSSRQDLHTLVQGLESWILGQEDGGVLEQLPGDQSSLRNDWQQAFADYYNSLDSQDTDAHPGDPDLSENSSTHDNSSNNNSSNNSNDSAASPLTNARHLLALLRQTASRAGVSLTVSGSAKHG